MDLPPLSSLSRAVVQLSWPHPSPRPPSHSRVQIKKPSLPNSPFLGDIEKNFPSFRLHLDPLTPRPTPSDASIFPLPCSAFCTPYRPPLQHPLPLTTSQSPPPTPVFVSQFGQSAVNRRHSVVKGRRSSNLRGRKTGSQTGRQMDRVQTETNEQRSKTRERRGERRGRAVKRVKVVKLEEMKGKKNGKRKEKGRGTRQLSRSL